MQKSVEDILRRVAERQGVPFELVRSIWVNEWRYAAFRMRCGKTGNYDSFRFVYLPGLMRIYTTRKKVGKMADISYHIEDVKDVNIRKWREKKQKEQEDE